MVFYNLTIYEIISLALGLGVLVLLIFLWRRLNQLQNFQKRFLQGATARDLEEVIIKNQENLRRALGDIQKLSQANRILAELHQLSIQKVGMVRFNPFPGEGSGGNQSFAIALLDAHGTGVVLSSIYGRDTQRVFAKPVTAGESSIPLTEEEKSAILKSREIEAVRPEDRKPEINKFGKPSGLKKHTLRRSSKHGKK